MNWLLLKHCFYEVIKPIGYFLAVIAGIGTIVATWIGYLMLLEHLFGKTWVAPTIGTVTLLTLILIALTWIKYTHEKRRRGL